MPLGVCQKTSKGLSDYEKQNSCFSMAGTGRLVKIKVKMNRAKYREILDENLLQRTQVVRMG
jgi:hypothetical protein